MLDNQKWEYDPDIFEWAQRVDFEVNILHQGITLEDAVNRIVPEDKREDVIKEYKEWHKND